MLVLDSRDAVSGTIARLAHFFQAKGVDVISTAIPGSKSNIYLGDGLGDDCL